MKSEQRRSARPDPARRRLRSNLEVLEGRRLLSQSPYPPVNGILIADSSPATNPGPVPPAQIAHPIGSSASALATVEAGNSGKVISGEDRQGNRYTITVKGPGYAIVTDTTPNDGVLDDDIDTITLIGTSATKTTVTGTVAQSYRTPSDYTQLPTLGQIRFNRLQSQAGVKSIILNGFVLTDTITQSPSAQALSPAEGSENQTTGISLPGGVSLLEFEGIDGIFESGLNPSPIVVSIGASTTPIKAKPTIRIDHIYNTAYDNTAFDAGGSGTIPTGPLTSPTVELFINGDVAAFHVVSISQEPDLSTLFPEINGSFLTVPTQVIPTNSAALEYQFPVVGTTGRTSVQAKSIEHIRAAAGVTNVTFSKSTQPFQSSLTGLDSVGAVQFGGPTDAVAIDSRGSIKSIKAAKGLGNPTNNTTVATAFGTPNSDNGYAASGLVGAQIVTEGNIGSLEVAPANTTKLYATSPFLIRSGLNLTDTYVVRPGTALTSTVVAAGGSIGKTHIVGDSKNSEIKSGYNYYSGVTGAEGVTGASSIGPVAIRGDLVDTVVSASYRPTNGNYVGGAAGDGTITGTQAGDIYTTTTGTTALGNKGSGFYSRYNNENKRPTSLGTIKNPTAVTVTTANASGTGTTTATVTTTNATAKAVKAKK